jgi:hypothetical protein
MPVQFTTYTTTALDHDASAADVQAALEALTPIAAGDVVVASSVTGVNRRWTITFQNNLGGQPIEPMTITPTLTGLGPTASIGTTTEGSMVGPTNEVQEVRIDGATGGSWTLTYAELTGRKLEQRIAMDWLKYVISNDTPLNTGINGQCYLQKIPINHQAAIIAGLRHPYFIVITPVSNKDLMAMGGERILASHFLAIKVMSPEAEPSQLSDLLQSRLDELFAPVLNEEDPTGDGWILTCSRDSQLNTSETDSAGQDWCHAGIVVEVNVRHTA